ncbi:hypothetical protein HM1_1742 [Heliomicrobium modesticaldum Ice1]|uniref:Uncharacterized protein n=1 Tax=Heliobacterium modesticaldum (strain ATCC 51547 / Ice1) TaxID=498761 RepID=B0TER0_HELMI|nr:hypothetical protein HM1_1742 [Heliomicrobium modesticaldum Ice1]
MQGGTRPWLNADAAEQINKKIKQFTQDKQITQFTQDKRDRQIGQKGKPKKTDALPPCWKNIGKSGAH